MSTDPAKARRHPRVSVHVPVRVSSIDPETDPTGVRFFREAREYCANLSAGGAFIRTRDPFPPGGRVLVEIHVPGEAPIEAVGRVAWAKTPLGAQQPNEEGGVGVEFLGTDRNASLALAQYLGPEKP